MKKGYDGLEDVIKEITNLSDVKKLPQPLQDLIKHSLENAGKIAFPIATFKENNEWVATTPLIDVCAQGETEKEAVDSIIDMIDDFMSDPHTKKPQVKTMMGVKIQKVSINLPLDELVVNKNEMT